MSVPNIGRAIRDALRENLVDPVGRPNAQWIHYKRVPVVPSDIGKTPTIYIEPIPFSGGFGIVGTTEHHRYIRFWVTIIGSIGDRGMIDGYPVTNTEELISYVSEKVHDYITKNAASITTVKQPNASSTNTIASIEEIDGVGGLVDYGTNRMGNRLVYEILENR